MAQRQGIVSSEIQTRIKASEISVFASLMGPWRVSALESLEEAEEGRPKLDGIGCLGHGGLVHIRERIIDDGAWASVLLGDHTGGREAQVGKVTN
jgi:hypothetical protein